MPLLNDIFVLQKFIMRLRFVLLSVLCLIGCKKEIDQQSEIPISLQDSIIIEKTDLESLNYTEFILDKVSEQNISGWLKYQELEEKINEIKQADISYFKSDKTIVEALITEFSTTIPENINTTDINARVLIVRNMYFKLLEISNLGTSTKEEMKKAIQDLLIAFSNLNFQINKKFERDAQNIEKP